VVSLARFSIRRPKIALAGWLVVAVVLSVIGLGVSKYVSPSVSVVPGTQSYRAQHLAEQKFGPSQLIPILLEGPKTQLNRQGPKLVAALAKRKYTRVLSAWDTGTASAGLRPKPTEAMIIASVNRSEKDVVKYDQPAIESLVSHHVTSPAKAYISGQPSIDKAWKAESVSAVRTYAWIAVGVLFVLLLVGLRAPLAAVIVTAIAGATTLSAFGVMAVLGKFMTIDAIALAIGALSGLARGTSWSLVMLDRVHRDEQANPDRPPASVITDAVGSTGRALLYAATVMLAAMLLADMLGPTDVVATLGIGTFICTLLATGAGVVVLPAALVLFGRRVNWRVPAPAFLSRTWDRMVGFGAPIVRHGAAVGALATLALLALAVPAFGVKSGPMDIRQLPPNDKARVAFNEISRVMGPGYATPYDVIVVNPNGPITTRAVLTKIQGFEKQIARDPATASVVGPGASFYSSANQLKSFGPTLTHSANVSKKSKKDLLKLISGLGLAGNGSKQLQSGLAAASSGAGQLQSGSGQAGSGSGQLHAGLAQALAGAQALHAGANQALSGAEQLASGLAAAPGAANQSVLALGSMRTLTSTTSSKVSGARGSLSAATTDINAAVAALGSMTSGKSDPQYQTLAGALQRASGAVAGASSDITAAAPVATQANALAGVLAGQAPGLVKQLQAAATGSGQLAAGIEKLRNGNGQLETGLGQLTAGAGQLQNGLARLTAGAGQLAAGLAGGVGPAGQLAAGLGTMQAAVIKARGQVPSTKDLEKLQAQSPGIFNSGYFVLAAIEGATPSNRNAATFAINLLQGGDAGQIVITSRYALSDKRTEQLGNRLRAMSSAFANSSHLEVAAGGPAGSLFDVAHTATSKLWRTIIITTLAITALLALLLRAILIPALAVLCATLVSAAGFGVMQLLFGGSNPPLGGPGTFDPVTTLEIWAALFGAPLIYLVVLLTRARDYFVVSGDARGSLVQAMRSTLAATSGVAATSIAVILPFAFSEMMGIRRIAVAAVFGIGVVAYLILPVLLPALMSIVGRFGWWPTSAAGTGPAKVKPPRRFHIPSFRHRGVVHP
jgi:putative drug exporter of the RND superfamily